VEDAFGISVYLVRESATLFQSCPGPYYPLGTIGAVPRVYEGMQKNEKIGKFNKKNTRFKNTFFSKTKIPL
jgi:hypothetical protein